MLEKNHVRSADICYGEDELWNEPSEKPDRKEHIWYDSITWNTQNWWSQKKKSKRALPGGRREWSYYLMDKGF